MQNVKPPMRSVFPVAAPFGAGLVVPGATAAGGEDDDVDMLACSKGEVWDSHLQRLDTLKDPNTAKALNDRGYATRKFDHTIIKTFCGTDCEAYRDFSEALDRPSKS